MVVITAIFEEHAVIALNESITENSVVIGRME